MKATIALLVASLCMASTAFAHPLAPGLLQMKEQGTETYSVLWRTSVARTPDGDVMPQLPPHCDPLSEPVVQVRGNSAFEQRQRVHCAGGLAGHELSISNLASTGINVVVRLESSQGVVLTGLIDAAQPVYRVPERSGGLQVVRDYFGLGLQHLLEGVDHLLFIVGLVLLVSGAWRLVGTVTAFTLGHSLTLGLATVGWIRVNPMLAEAGIALSLLVLAIELARPNPNAWIRRQPWNMAAAFGLLHGLGFASALSETGVPTGELIAALLGFNLGIEAGQLAVVAVALLLGLLAGQVAGATGWRRPVRVLSVYAMGSLAAFWCIERLAAGVI